jgi:hypothetical protein
MEKKYKNLAEFYPYYLLEHQNLVSRCLHFVGTASLLLVLIYGLFTQNYWILACCPVLGYGFAWVGHFFFEKNRPATFTYPAMSLISDFIMFYHIATLQIGRQISEAKKTMNENIK